MNRDTKIRFEGMVYSGPAHILEEMTAIIKSYPCVEDPVVIERDGLIAEKSAAKEAAKPRRSFKRK